MRSFLKRSVLIAPLFFILVLNQNCGEYIGNSVSREFASIHDPTMLEVDQPYAKARLGNRIYVASVFAEVFLPSGAVLSYQDVISKAGGKADHIAEFITSNFDAKKDKALTDKIILNVLEQTGDFHGGCIYSEKDMTCASRGEDLNRRSEIRSETVSPNTVSREGYRMSTCNFLISQDRAVENVIFNIAGRRTFELNKDDIGKVYDLFYPAQPFPDEVKEELQIFVDKAVENQESRLDVWRAVILPICQSSAWQII